MRPPPYYQGPGNVLHEDSQLPSTTVFLGLVLLHRERGEPPNEPDPDKGKKDDDDDEADAEDEDAWKKEYVWDEKTQTWRRKRLRKGGPTAAERLRNQDEADAGGPIKGEPKPLPDQRPPDWKKPLL